jgi:hypothetical protein
MRRSCRQVAQIVAPVVFGAALLLAAVPASAWEYVIGPPRESGRGEAGRNGRACAGLDYSIPKRIKLKRPVAGMVFLDGSFSPPWRILPPAR